MQGIEVVLELRKHPFRDRFGRPALGAVRIGRGCENKKISLLRTPKIWPVTSAPASLSRAVTNGAIFSGTSFFRPSTRLCCSGVLVGMESIMRVQAKGATALERTLNRCMSSAIDFDSPTMPSFAAA